MKRIFIGFHNIVGSAINLLEGFEKIGYKADFYSIEKQLHKFNYLKSDTEKIKHVKIRGVFLVRKFKIIFFFIKILLKYNYFIYFIGAGRYLLKNYLDLKILNFLGKKTCLICVGCDVRVPELVLKFVWNVCKICNDEYKSFVGCIPNEKKKKNDNLEKVFNYIFCPIECGQGFKKYYNFLFPVRVKVVHKHKLQNRGNKLLIIHSPSNEIIKGTIYIENVIFKLKNKYNFEFLKIINASKDSAHELLSTADLIIDQMLVGFYGVFAIEAMMLGKPVICYIRNDIWENIKDECPIYNANPDSLYKVLEDILQNTEQLKERGKRSKEYAFKYHSPENVAEYIISKIENTN